MSGCIITIDAIGCHKDIAAKIIEKQAHYILAVKENQARLLDDIKEAFEEEEDKAISTDVQTNIGHGWIEKRSCRVITDMDLIAIGWVCKSQGWKGLGSIIEITAERTEKKTGKHQKERRYYISDLLQSAREFNLCIRTHWSIENKQHWILDVAFNEDKSRKRAKNAAENFGILNRLALNIIKADNSVKASVKRKQKMAGWDDQYLERFINTFKI